MHMVTRLSRKMGVVMVFKNDWAVMDKQRYRVRLRCTKTGGQPTPPPLIHISLALTLSLWLAIHLQVHGGEAELVSILSGQIVMLQAAAHTETATHCGHLAVELFPCDFVVKTQPAELNLHAERAEKR